MGFLIEDLYESAKLRTLGPISQNTFTESDLVTIAKDELLSKVVPQIFAAREDFFLARKTVALRNGVSAYGIPQRAIGNTLTALFYVDQNGNKRPLDRLDVTDLYKFAGVTGEPLKFYFSGDEVVLLPSTPATAVGSLEMHFYARPSSPILTSSCAKITDINSASGFTTFTVNTDLSSVLASGSQVDFLSAKSPFLLWAEEIAITNITSTTIEVAQSSVIDESSTVQPVVGDYICPTGFSNIPMIPIEFHPALSGYMSARILSGLGDVQKLEVVFAETEKMMFDALKLIRNRIEGAPEKIRIKNPLLDLYRGR